MKTTRNKRGEKDEDTFSEMEGNLTIRVREFCLDSKGATKGGNIAPFRAAIDERGRENIVQ